MLCLAKNHLVDEDLKILAEPLAVGLPALVDLNLYGNHIGDEGLDALSTALSGALATGALAKLETLVLTANEIGDRGAISLSKAVTMGALGCIRCIHLDHNNVYLYGVEAMHAVAKARDFHVNFASRTEM